MGNVLGHQQPGWIPNIAPNDGPNDLNNPLSSKTRDAFLTFAMPTFTLVVMAKIAYAFQRERQRLLKDYDSQISVLQSELDHLRSTSDVQRAQQTVSRRLGERLDQIQNEEYLKYSDQMNQLKWYDEGLKAILDIRCSPFKSHQRREPLENELLGRIATDRSLEDVNVYYGIKDSIDYDHLYCGKSRDSNGKFRQVYMQMYREKLRLAMERRVVNRISEELSGKSH